MSGLGWKLRRLSAMSAGEIARRARIALRDRFLPPRWSRLAPAAAYAELWRGDAAKALATSHLERWLEAPGDAPAFDAVRAEAQALAAGRWTLFGQRVSLDDPPRWNRNPLTGAEWPDAPSRALDHRRSDVAGGAKFAWELSRLGVLPDLALAARLTGERAHAERACRWLDDWTARNPLGHGLHHTSGIEQALRVINVSATLALLDDEGPRPRLEPALGLLAQQARWCAAHLSLGSSANNHLIAEYAAMAVAGTLFPALRGARSLGARGLAGIEREVDAQFHADGVHAEQAFGYLPFVWELVLASLRAGEAAHREAGDAVTERLQASLEFARAIRLPGGRFPQVGDEDDGRVLLVAEGPSRLDLAGNALAAWLDAEALSDDAPALAALLTGRPPRPARAAADGRHVFPLGGWSVWRERGLLVTFDHGPLGLPPLAAHGHADALAITVWRNGDGLVVDPGTLAYQEDRAARERCRATPAHATVHFGGRSQSQSLGPFLWGRRAEVSPDGAGHACTWWTGERHVRTVEVGGAVVVVDDRASGRHPTLVFPLAPGAALRVDGAKAVVTSGRSRATFAIEGAKRWEVEDAEHGARFGVRVPSQRLIAKLGERARTTIETGEA